MMTNKKEFINYSLLIKERTEGRDQGVSRELVWFCKEKEKSAATHAELADRIACLPYFIHCMREMYASKQCSFTLYVSTRLLPC